MFPGALLAPCISGVGFGKAHSQSTPFVSIGMLFLVESQNKPKQTPPEYNVHCPKVFID
jgi:hypothetical protein